jgi:very-short-patch-repair endonuclease
MKLYYQKHLNPFARKLRKGGNLSEVLLWNELKKDKLGYRFLRQRPIEKYIIDFYCPSLNLAIEIDGAATHDNKVEKDKARQKSLELLGVKVIRFMDADVRYRLDGVLESIKSEILRLASLPLRQAGSPPPLGKEE